MHAVDWATTWRKMPEAFIRWRSPHRSPARTVFRWGVKNTAQAVFSWTPGVAACPRILHSLAPTTRARVFITNTTLHNPTGTTISREVADNILMIARHNGMTIVEDDIFAELNRNRYCSLASLDSRHSVIYVGSFSK